MNDIKGIIEDCYKSDLVSDRVIKKVVEIIGQGEWQNLHDENSDICTTMGELIITLDGIADLEKENAELKTKVTAIENANRAMVKELDDTTSGGLNILQNVVKNKEELTKAKELLNEFMRISKASDEDFEHDYSELIAEAEQFISEVEKC